MTFLLSPGSINVFTQTDFHLFCRFLYYIIAFKIMQKTDFIILPYSALHKKKSQGDNKKTTFPVPSFTSGKKAVRELPSP